MKEQQFFVLKELDNDLFNENIGLVNLFVNRMDYGYIERDDIYQAGLMGLFQATKKYDSSVGVTFSTFASYYILGEIKKELRENRLIKYSKDVCKVKRELSLIKQKIDLKLIEDNTKVNKNVVQDVCLNYFDIIKFDNDSMNLIKGKDKSLFSYMNNCLDGIFLDVIQLRYVNCYTQIEIGNMLGYSQSKISRIEKIALEKLKRHYQNYKNN